MKRKERSMKKRLFAIALVLMLTLTLLPTAAYADDEGSADLGTAKTHCYKCGTITTFEILAYIRTPIASKPDPLCHWARAKCTECGTIAEFVPEGKSAYHTGGTETPTCTTGKICEKCGDEYGILGHIWSEWTNPTEGTHRRVCQREGCNAVEEGSCDGTATCQARAKCTVCGAERGEKSDHSFSNSWRSDTEQHWHYCLTRGCDARLDVGYHNINDNHYCPTCYTSPIPCMDTDNDHKCDGCGKVLTGHTDTDNNHVCDLCGEVLHDLKHVPASAATSRVNGNTEYWYCEGCGKYYADAEAKTEITQASTVIPATGRRPAPTTPAASVSSPKTGDAGVLLYAGMAILSLTGCAWLRRKEQ